MHVHSFTIIHPESNNQIHHIPFFDRKRPMKDNNEKKLNIANNTKATTNLTNSNNNNSLNKTNNSNSSNNHTNETESENVTLLIWE